MARVFVCLAAAQFLVFGITAVAGWVDPSDHPDRHVLLGVFSLLLSCLIQVVVFTYFTVTGKMIAQALHIGHLDIAPLDEVKSLKRNVTRNLAGAVWGILLVTITGAIHWRSGEFASWHIAAAMLTILVHGLVFYNQYNLVVRNGRLLDQTFEAYDAARRSGRSRTETAHTSARRQA